MGFAALQNLTVSKDKNKFLIAEGVGIAAIPAAMQVKSFITKVKQQGGATLYSLAVEEEIKHTVVSAEGVDAVRIQNHLSDDNCSSVSPGSASSLG